MSQVAEELPDGEEGLEEERRTSYLELFFDLVFVFAITQVTTLVLSDTSAAGFARSLLVLGLVWWAWAGYSWTTNVVDLSTRAGRGGLLTAMAAAFFMAIVLPESYGGQGAWFGAAYLALRVQQPALQLYGLRNYPTQLRAALTITPFFLLSPVLIMAGGLLDGSARVALWAVALAIDIAGALNAGRSTWRISAQHFAERHALFVIIALGESIVAIGLGAAGAERTLELAGAIAVAFAGVAALWWAYFDFVAAGMERALSRAPTEQRGHLARDVFTFIHFPIVSGVVLFAVAAKKAVAHGGEPLSAPGRFALAAGIALFLGGLALGRYRAVRKVAGERIVAAGAVAVVAAAATELAAAAVVAIAVAILAVALVVEGVRMREVRAQLRSG